MTKDTIVSVLESEGLKSGAKGFELPEGRELDCFIRSSSEMVTVSRVCRVALPKEFVTFENRKGELFFFGYEDVIGFRIGVQEAAGKDRTAAGFFR